MEPEDDEIIVFPPEILQAIDERNRLSLIVKLLNPKVQKSRQISLALPKAWRLTGSVRSMTLAYNSKVQFFFEMNPIFSRGLIKSHGPSRTGC